jgi:hypothetical protein
MSGGAALFQRETRQRIRLQLTRNLISMMCQILPLNQTFAIEDVVLVCDLDLSLDLGREGGSEAACIVGRLVNGSMVPPGLADLDIRGQAIVSGRP